jgi:hypothetical protein
VEGLAVVVVLTLTPLVFLAAFLVIDPKRVVVKRGLGVLVALSPTLPGSSRAPVIRKP